MRTALYRLYDAWVGLWSSFEFGGSLLVLKTISVIISLGLIIVIILLILKTRQNIENFLETLRESLKDKDISDLPQEIMDERWKSVLDKFKTGDESGCKMAIIEADKMLDDVLKRKGFEGEDMGERLKQAEPSQLSNPDAVWQAHRVRNQIAHEPDFRITQEQARRAIEIYQRALEDLS